MFVSLHSLIKKVECLRNTVSTCSESCNVEEWLEIAESIKSTMDCLQVTEENQTMLKIVDACKLGGTSAVLLVQKLESKEDFEASVMELHQTLDELNFLLNELISSDPEGFPQLQADLDNLTCDLEVLVKSRVLNELFENFKNFINSVKIISESIMDLPFTKAKGVIECHFACFKLTIPILNSLLQEAAKLEDDFPNPTMKEELHNEMKTCLEKISSVVNGKRSFCEENQVGHFVSNMDEVLDILGTNDCRSLNIGILKRGIDSILKHANLVADFPFHLYDEDIRSLSSEIDNCRHNLIENLSHAENEIGMVLHELRERLESALIYLESIVNEAVITTVVDVLSEPCFTGEKLKDYEGGGIPSNFVDGITKVMTCCRLAGASCAYKDKNTELHVSALKLQYFFHIFMICQGQYGSIVTMTNWQHEKEKVTHTIDSLLKLELIIKASEELSSQFCHTRYESMDDMKADMKRVHDLGGRILSKCDLHIQSWKEMDVIMNYLKSALILLQNTSTRSLDIKGQPPFVEEAKLRLNVVHTCFSGIRKLLEKKHERRLRELLPSNSDSTSVRLVSDYENFHKDEGGQELPAEVEFFLSRPIPRLPCRPQDHALKQQTEAISSEFAGNDAEVKDLLQQAGDGYQTRVNLLGNDIVARSNKLVCMVRRVAAVLDDDETQKLLNSAATNLVNLSFQLLNMADTVVKGDSTKISELHNVAQDWYDQFQALHGKTVLLLQPWLSLSDLEGCIMDVPEEVAHGLSDFSAMWSHLSFSFTELVTEFGRAQIDSTSQHCLRSLTADLKQMKEEARVLLHEAQRVTVQKESLRAASESWSCSAVVLHHGLARLFRLLTIGCGLRGPETPPRLNPSQADRLIRFCSLETAQLQANLSYLEKCSGCSQRDTEKLASLVCSVKQLTEILDAELHTFEAHVSESARVSACIRFWTSACQCFAECSTCNHLIDRLVEEFSRPFLQVLGAAIVMNGSQEESPKRDYKVLRQFVVDKWMTLREEILDFIEDSPEKDIEFRTVLRSTTDDLGRLTTRIFEQSDKLCLLSSDEVLKEALSSVRLWACRLNFTNSLLKNHPGGMKIGDIVKQLTTLMPATEWIRYEDVPGQKWIECRHRIHDGSFIETASRASAETSEAATPKVSMPLNRDSSSVIHFPRIISSKTFDSIASALEHETEKWEDDNNEVVRVAKEISRRLSHMLAFLHGGGPIKSRGELLEMAKEIAHDGSKMIDYAKLIAKFTVDEPSCARLNAQANLIALPAAQLSILARVKESFLPDATSIRQVTSTAENLMRAIARTLQAAEECCVHGLHTESANDHEKEVLGITSNWVARLQSHYRKEASETRVDALGLRRISLSQPPPHLTDVFLQR